MMYKDVMMMQVCAVLHESKKKVQYTDVLECGVIIPLYGIAGFVDIISCKFGLDIKRKRDFSSWRPRPVPCGLSWRVQEDRLDHVM